jgi:hypothetical protein
MGFAPGGPAITTPFVLDQQTFFCVSAKRCRPTLSGRTRSPSLLRWIKLSSPPCDQSGGRERGGGKRDGADRALDSYFVPLPPCRHTSAGLLAHLLGRPLDPDAERSAQSSGRTSSVRLSALRDQII